MKENKNKNSFNFLLMASVFTALHAVAFGASSYQVTFINTPASIIEPYLTSMGASSNQVMRYTGTEWKAASLLTSNIYRGTWDANTNTPNLTMPLTEAGNYYLVTVAGSLSGITYSPGDWIISNGSSWEKVDNSTTLVSSFNSRIGSVTSIPEDYVTLKNPSGKLSGSSINDFADVNIVAPVGDSILKYDSVSNKWIVGVDEEELSAYIGTPNRSVVTNGSGDLTSGTATSIELGYLSGVTSSIQTQLNSLKSIALLDGNILVGNISNAPIGLALTGDATISNSGVLTLKNTGTAGTYTSVTVDAQGRVTAGTNPAVNAITSLTTDVTASGSGSVTATIASGAVNSSKVSNGTILPSDLDFTGSNINTSGLMIRNLTGGFSSLVCSNVGHAPTWTLTGFTCAMNGTGVVSGTSGRISKFSSSSKIEDSIMSESSSTLTLNGTLVLPATSSTQGYVTIDGKRFLSSFNGFFLGKQSGNFTSTDDYNVGIGEDSLQSISTGDNNVAIGRSAGKNISTGTYNTFIGTSAGGTLTAGTRNTYVGYAAGASRSTGSYNTYVGNSVGALWTGSYNTAVGANSASGGAGFGGSYNTFLGFESGFEVQGARNVLLGYKAGRSITTGSNNVIIGGHLGADIATASNNIIIADGDGNERIRVLSNGNVGIGTINPAYKLQVGEALDGTEARANSWNSFSDERLKKDFEIIPHALDKILSLNGYYYYWNQGPDDHKKMGVKAQEVEKVFPEIVSLGMDGYLSVSYDHLVAGVISALKEFHQKWQDDNDEIYSEIKIRQKNIATNKLELNSRFHSMDVKIESLRNDNQLVRKYLCSKDPAAAFCQ